MSIEKEIKALKFLIASYFGSSSEEARTDLITEQFKATNNEYLKTYDSYTVKKLEKQLDFLQDQFSVDFHVEEIIHVPGERPFTKRVCDCKNNFRSLKETLPLIDMDRVVNEAVCIVKKNVMMGSLDGYQIPPLVFKRMVCGGKTTTLSYIFNKLKDTSELNVIGITFTSQKMNYFQYRNGETQSQAILRLITSQLIDCTDKEKQQLVVNRIELDKYLGNNVVLLIDNLNKGETLDKEATEMLCEMFLDRPGRYLVFTTHVRMTLDNLTRPDAGSTTTISGSNKSNSNKRGIVTVNMSLANNLKELQLLPGCETLTPSQASWYSYIPSLVYTTMMNNYNTPELRIQQTMNIIDSTRKLTIIKRFVKELLSGEPDILVSKYFDQFNNLGNDFKVSYPLCYIKGIFEKFREYYPDLKVVIGIIDKIQMYEERTVRSDFYWHDIIKLAIVLRCLDASLNEIEGPFKILPAGIKPALQFITLPSGIMNIKQATRMINIEVNKYNNPTLFFIHPIEINFESVECMVVYSNGKQGNNKKITKIGYKTTKAVDKINVKVINAKFLDHCYLFNSHITTINPISTTTNTTTTKEERWTYLSMQEVFEVLGTSLKLTIPGDEYVLPAEAVNSKIVVDTLPLKNIPLKHINTRTITSKRDKYFASTVRKYTTTIYICNSDNSGISFMYIDCTTGMLKYRFHRTSYPMLKQSNATIQCRKFYSTTVSCGLRFIRNIIRK